MRFQFVQIQTDFYTFIPVYKRKGRKGGNLGSQNYNVRLFLQKIKINRL